MTTPAQGNDDRLHVADRTNQRICVFGVSPLHVLTSVERWFEQAMRRREAGVIGEANAAQRSSECPVYTVWNAKCGEG